MRHVKSLFATTSQSRKLKKHKDRVHQYYLVENMFEKHKEEIAVSVEPVEEQLDVVSKALEHFDSFYNCVS